MRLDSESLGAASFRIIVPNIFLDFLKVATRAGE
jgi:hypothetical protein